MGSCQQSPRWTVVISFIVYYRQYLGVKAPLRRERFAQIKCLSGGGAVANSILINIMFASMSRSRWVAAMPYRFIESSFYKPGTPRQGSVVPDSMALLRLEKGLPQDEPLTPELPWMVWKSIRTHGYLGGASQWTRCEAGQGTCAKAAGIQMRVSRRVHRFA